MTKEVRSPKLEEPNPAARIPSPEPRAPSPERRSISRDLAAPRVESRQDGARAITGYAAVFYDGSPETEYELWSGARERILPGAFDRAVREDDVRALVNHNPDLLLGRAQAATLRLSVDARGLRYEIDPPDTSAARDLVASLERGDLSGSSFSFSVTDEEWLTENEVQIRLIKGVRLFDVGPVTFPAYEGTTSGLRALGEPQEARQSHQRWQAARRAAEAERIDVDLRLAEVGARD